MALNIILSILIWGTTAALILSILTTSGLLLPSFLQKTAFAKKYLKFLNKTEKFQTGFSPARKTYLEVFFSTFFLRIAMVLFAAIAICLFMSEETLKLDDFLQKFVIWDANSYVNIAKGGYTEYMENGEPITLVFFPFYSALIRIISVIIPDIRLAGLVTSAICFSTGCCLLYSYVAKNYGGEIAKKAVYYLSLSPFGFFFGTLMSESTFFMMICLCLYFINENKWGLFSIAGILCSLSRMQGILIIIPACIQWFEKYQLVYHIRKKNWKQIWENVYKRFIFIPIPIVGTLLYLWINHQVAGNAFAFLDYQRRYWTHGYQYIGKAMAQNLKNAFTGGLTIQHVSIWIPQLFFFLLALGLCIYGAKRHDNKLTAYLLAYTVISYSLDWLISGPRYMLTAVPMWIFLAELGYRFKRLDRVITVLSPILMGIYFTGYLFMKQIV
ncbi:MAG: hypothetical protein J1F02_02995 [Lachnospiraceae bacterium]|nr:hypothetical protein [Lachnospiraceae bacterium]